MEHAFLDEYSHSDSFIHRLEPRIKIACFFLFVFYVAFQRSCNVYAYGAYAIVMMSLVRVSRIPLAFVFRRVVSVLPFIVMIALSIPFMKAGQEGATIALGSLKLSVSFEGVVLFVSIVIKACLSIIAMTLLMASTDFSQLLKAFEKLHVPGVLLMVLSFMYRYLFVIEDELMKMRLAKDSRTIGGSKWFHLKAQANMLGVLFIRAYERAEKVYLAMCARGYEGKMRTLYDAKVTLRDVLFLVIFSGVITIIKLNG